MKIQRILFIGMILSVALGLQSCPTGSPVPLFSLVGGRWEWVKTVTPTRTITPETAGYREDMNYSNDGNSDYLAYYRNDTLRRKLIRNQLIFIETNNKDNTLLINYGKDGYIKFYLKFNQDNVVHDIKTSELMQVYSRQADTVRHYYKYMGLAR